ncbi:hypothetical protein DRO54_06605, partial [Candidatus Bathyarchaeota archaeon]
MSKISRRHFLKGKEIRKLITDIKDRIKISEELLGKNPKVEVAEADGIKIFIFD